MKIRYCGHQAPLLEKKAMTRSRYRIYEDQVSALSDVQYP